MVLGQELMAVIPGSGSALLHLVIHSAISPPKTLFSGPGSVFRRSFLLSRTLIYRRGVHNTVHLH